MMQKDEGQEGKEQDGNRFARARMESDKFIGDISKYRPDSIPTPSEDALVGVRYSVLVGVSKDWAEAHGMNPLQVGGMLELWANGCPLEGFLESLLETGFNMGYTACIRDVMQERLHL